MPKIGFTVRPLFAKVALHYHCVQCRSFLSTVTIRRRDEIAQAQLVASPRPILSKVDETAARSPGLTTKASPTVSHAYAALSQLLSQSPELDALHTNVLKTSALLTSFSDTISTRILLEHVSQNHPHHTMLTLRLAILLKAPIKKNVYECIMHHLSMKREWIIVLEVSTVAKEQGQLTVRSLNWRVNALALVRNFAVLQGVIQEFDACGLRPNRKTYHMLIAAHLRNKDLRRVQHVMDVMEANGIPVDPSTHAMITISHHNLGSNPQVHTHALNILEKVPPRIATTVLNTLWRSRLTANDIDGAKQLLSRYKYRQITPIITALLGIIPSNDGHLMDMEGVDADAGTYANVVNFLALRKDLSATLGLLAGMKQVGISPDAEVAAALMHAYFSVGDLNSAVQVVSCMCGNSFKKSFARIVSTATPLQLPLDLHGIAPTIKVFNSLCRGVLSIQGLDGVVLVLKIMHSKAIHPNTQTLQILVNHLVNVERTPPKALFRVLRELSSKIPPTLFPFHSIFSSMLRQERFLVYGKGWDKTAAPFSPKRPFISSTVQSPDRSTATKPNEQFDPTAGLLPAQIPPYARWFQPFLDALSSGHHRSDAAMFALRLQRDASLADFKSSQSIFDTLLRRGFQPNEYHYAALMEGFTRAGDIEAAKGLLETARKANIKPNIVMFTIIIVGYARQADTANAMATFQELLAAGLHPDIPAIDALVSAYFAAGKYRSARDLLMQSWGYIAPFPEHLMEASLRDLTVEFRMLEGRVDPLRGHSKQQRMTLYKKLRNLTRSVKAR